MGSDSYGFLLNILARWHEVPEYGTKFVPAIYPGSMLVFGQGVKHFFVRDESILGQFIFPKVREGDAVVRDRRPRCWV